MNFDCTRIEDALREEDPALLAAAQAHAAGCEQCRAELENWRAFTAELNATARGMRAEWESQELWERSDAALPLGPRKTRWAAWGGWQLMATAAALVLISAASAWLALRPARQQAPPRQQAARQSPGHSLELTSGQSPVRKAGFASRQFLTEQALAEAKQSEAAYVRSLERLSKVAGPALNGAPAPLMDNYREKLMLLDAAIADLRENREHNMLNANLNTELLTLYREKQKTLQEVIHYASQSN